MRRARFAWSLGLLLGLSFIMRGATAHAQDAGAVLPASAATAKDVPESGMPLAELERLLAPLGEGSIEARRAAAKVVSELGPEATQAIGQKVLELRKTTGAAVLPVVKAAKDQAGNKELDLVEAMLASRGDPAGVRAALAYACAIKALAHIGTTPAVRVMVAMASDAGGAFRPELTKQMKQLGERSIAALIEARRDTSQDTRNWASNLLDGMGKRLSSDTVQTKSNQVLADVVRAYGTVRDLDAVPVILSFVNSDRAQVRAAAREALESYGQDAVWKLREAYSALTGKPALEAWTAKELSKELFEAYDRFRLQEVYQLLDEGIAKHRAGQVEAAVLAFDKVLARQPMLDRRNEMVAAYFELAQSLEESDRPRALAYLRKALRLDEAGRASKEIQGEIHYLEAEELLARGIADADLFRRAIALDPRHARARAELARIETDLENKQSNVQRWVAAGAVFAIAVAAIILFGGRRRGPRPPARRARA